MSDTDSRLHASDDTSRGLDRFRHDLDPAVVDEIAAWAADPELGKLCAGLRAIPGREKFLNMYAEAMVARYLLARGCRLRVEILTPAGRTCDFEVTLDGHRFFLHVKRLNTDRAVRRRLTVSSRLRYLERISRPYVVSVRFNDGLSDAQMQRYVTVAAEFIGHARVGDELVIRDDEGTEIGGCRIVAPWQGSRVTLVLGLPTGFIDEAPRIRRLMRKAYQQFMPGAANVILVCSSHVEDADDFGNALLGSHIERWDAHPPRGRRVAHGRDADGFWHGRRFPESAAAGWFHFRPQASALQCRLWIRPESTLDESLQQALVSLFNGHHD
ncbi:MAG: hypothetical protein ACYTGE_02995 [Planctomycetota bacterium]|jgi:hypothetical protein